MTKTKTNRAIKAEAKRLDQRADRHVEKLIKGEVELEERANRHVEKLLSHRRPKRLT